jgi:carbonic anhydrase
MHSSPRGRANLALDGTDIENDRKQSVVDDVTRIRNHPLIPSAIPIYGFIYDVKTGMLNEVEEATRAGRTGRP